MVLYVTVPQWTKGEVVHSNIVPSEVTWVHGLSVSTVPVVCLTKYQVGCPSPGLLHPNCQLKPSL